MVKSFQCNENGRLPEETPLEVCAASNDILLTVSVAQ